MRRLKQAEPGRRTALKQIILPSAGLTVWSVPVVQSVLLPAHAQASMCAREDIVGHWHLELKGAAASTRELEFFDDGSASSDLVNAWQYRAGNFQMTRGSAWKFEGRFSACDFLAGTYVNIFTIPIIGNLIVREGAWQATKLG